MFEKISFIIFFILIDLNINWCKSVCPYAPNRCKWLAKSETPILLCTDLNSRFDRAKHENLQQNECKSSNSKIWPSFFFNLIFRHYRGDSYILDNSFQLHEYSNYEEIYIASTFKFIGLKGLDARLALHLENPYITFTFQFYHMYFRFFNEKRKVIRTCHDYQLASSWTSQRNFIFSKSTNSNLLDIELRNVKFVDPVCPIIFDGASFFELTIWNLIQSFYKKNIITYSEISNHTEYHQMKINSSIYHFILHEFYSLDLNLKLIHVEIFQKTADFKFCGVINSIQTDLFEWFPNFKSISFDPVYFRDLVRRQGIEWIRRMNANVNVDIENDVYDFQSNVKYIKEIKFTTSFTRLKNEFFSSHVEQFFYDEDFCLIREFPFQQMILFNIEPIETMLKNETRRLSCSTIWLIRFYSIYVKYSKIAEQKYQNNETINHLDEQIRTVINSCDFSNRIKRCNLTRFNLKQTKRTYEFEFMIVSQFFLDIFTPILCFLGIISNQIIFVVVLNKENRKTLLKQKQYQYMVINTVSNIIILSIQILSIINNCQYPFGIFCSSVRTLVGVQYIKIIVVECFGSFFRLFSNFTYVAFSIARLSLVGQNGSLVKFISEFSLKFSIPIFILVCGPLSVIKGFRFQINMATPEENYPFVFYRNFIENFEFFYNSLNVVFIFDLVYDLVTYVMFNFVNLMIDCYLLFKIKKVLREKEKKFETLSALIKESRKNENEKVIENTTWMIVLNALVNFTCKMPLSIISINDLRISAMSGFKVNSFFSTKNLFNFPYLMGTLCYLDEMCLVFFNFCTFLYVISLSVNIFFYYKYDRNFRNAFDLTFFGVTTTNNTNLNVKNNQVKSFK